MHVSEEIKRAVWNKGVPVAGYNPDKVRKDACRAWIVYDLYGDTASDFGWEIDHIYPASKLQELSISQERIDNLINLRPLQWENNKSKGSDYPNYQAAVVSDNEFNIHNTAEKTVNKKRQESLKDFFKI